MHIKSLGHTWKQWKTSKNQPQKHYALALVKNKRSYNYTSLVFLKIVTTFSLNYMGRFTRNHIEIFDTKQPEDHSNPLNKHTKYLIEVAPAHRKCQTHHHLVISHTTEEPLDANWRTVQREMIFLSAWPSPSNYSGINKSSQNHCTLNFTAQLEDIQSPDHISQRISQSSSPSWCCLKSLWLLHLSVKNYCTCLALFVKKLTFEPVTAPLTNKVLWKTKSPNLTWHCIYKLFFLALNNVLTISLSK